MAQTVVKFTQNLHVAYSYVEGIQINLMNKKKTIGLLSKLRCTEKDRVISPDEGYAMKFVLYSI